MRSDWEHVPLSVLYDIMSETATQLGGEYTALIYAAHDAHDEDSAAFWRGESVRLTQHRLAVDPDDAAQIIQALDHFSHTYEVVHRARTGSATRPAHAQRVPQPA